jgi:hypothetical protein
MPLTKITNESNGNKLVKDCNKSRVILFYRLNGCGHCEDFKELLDNVLRQNEELKKMANIYEIEFNCFSYIPPNYTRNVYAFPYVASFENGVKKEEFNSQRTISNLVNFIKKNSDIKTKKRSNEIHKKRELKKYASI